MDIQAITATTAQTVTQTTTTPAVPTVTQEATPAFDLTLTTLAAAPSATATATPTAADAAVDLNAADVEAQVQQAALAQLTVLSAMRSGADVSNLLSGLPPGATATLLGGGLVRTPAGVNPAEVEALWAFHFPFRKLDVPAVTSSTRAEPSRDNDKHPGSAPSRGHGPRGEKEPMPGPGPDTILDILD